jgi:hypothetical protein
MLYLYTKFCMPTSSGSLIIEIKVKAIENIRTTTMLLF